MLECTAETVSRLLAVIEADIVPQTHKGVRSGNKVFGAAILRKADLSLVVAGTNAETENPLWHGEVNTIKQLYEMPAEQRPDPKDCVFVSTHEPCPMCLSAITWGGYDNFIYLFSYQDSRDAFNIPHDLRIMKEVFAPTGGSYAPENFYWKAASMESMIDSLEASERAPLQARIQALNAVYAEMSEVYQANKGTNPVPLP